ncbi:MAG TPA: ATP-binding protein [Acetobacteraceae bacterium]|nr:ATP-binding protein [Acetobacteraceae bacterium]
MQPAVVNQSSERKPGDAAAIAARPATRWQQARTQIGVILTVGTCVIALLWLIMIDVILNERRAAIEHARAEANNLSAAFQSELSQTLASVARAVDAVADHMRAAQGAFDMHEWASDIPLLAAATIQAGIVGPDGKVVASTLDAHPAPIDVSDREHFRIHLDGKFHGLFISKPIIGRLSGQASIQVSQRVDAADGRFLGVVVFSLAPDQLTRLNKSIDLGPGGLMAVVGTTDQVIRARFATGSESGDFGAGERVPPLPPTVDENAPVQMMIRESVVDHVTRLFSMRNIPGFPLRVAVGFDLSEVLGPAARHAALIETTGIIATLMLVGLMALLTVEIRRRNDREMELREEQTRLAAEIGLGAEVQGRLRASEARLRDFAEMASDWFWEQDAELRFVPVRFAGAPLASDVQSLHGKRRWEVNDTSQAPERWTNHQIDLLAHRPFRDFRFARPAQDGKVQHVSINGDPIYDETGTFAGYRGTGSDITDLVEAEAELRRSKEQAEASSTAKSTFLANMSHELRTPLNAIIGFAELIVMPRTGRVDDDHVEWAGDILASGRHLLDLINDVLELSRIEAGRYDLADDTVDLYAMSRSCLAMIRNLAEKSQVRTVCSIAPGAAVLQADQRAIKQVVLNLLTNAVKFTPAGGLVSVRMERGADGAISLIVTDTGIGIDPEALPRLGKPFVQADASTSRHYGGSGLGLAISSRLVALHGGSLTISSVLGQGTEVRVMFPEARVVAPVSAVDVVAGN